MHAVGWPRECCHTPCLTCEINERPVVRTADHRSHRCQPGWWLSTDHATFSTLWMTPVDNLVSGYFHCVDTTNPPAMKPKPTAMFQFPSCSIGKLPCVT